VSGALLPEWVKKQLPESGEFRAEFVREGTLMSVNRGGGLWRQASVLAVEGGIMPPGKNVGHV
jgi:hypothetical protein